jgi:hypothetical protein
MWHQWVSSGVQLHAPAAGEPSLRQSAARDHSNAKVENIISENEKWRYG